MTKSWIRVVMAAGLAAAVLGVTCPAPAQAGAEKKAAKAGEEYYKGEVSAVDFKAGTVTVKKGDAGTMTFQCPQAAKYYVKNKKTGASLQDFKVGDKVEVWYAVQNGTPTCATLAEEGAHAHKKERKGE